MTLPRIVNLSQNIDVHCFIKVFWSKQKYLVETLCTFNWMNVAQFSVSIVKDVLYVV